MCARLHVVDAGAVDLVALAPQRITLGERAGRVDRVEMAQDKNAFPVAAPGTARDQMVAETIPAFDPLGLGAQTLPFPVRLGDKAGDGGAVAGRGLDLDPALDAVEQFLGVERGEVGEGGRRIGHDVSRRLDDRLS